ncbi:MAG: AMP-binding protein [Paludibacteraceae bacterium]|nr:AMP-binding protein [Paludibacteraceae bacterium]
MFTSDDVNLIKIFERSFRDNWECPAITDYGTTNTLTYSQLSANIARLHLLFKACGIEKDDRIAVMGRNNCNWVTTYLATITYGAVIVPILQDFKANDAMHLLHHSDSKLFFVTDLIWEGMELAELESVQAVYSLADFHLIATRIEKPESITFESTASALQKAYPNGFSKDDVHYDERSNESIASINYTSGTTGFSKGVMTTNNALASHLHYFLGTNLIYRGCRHVAFLPLAHAYGCIVDFLGALAAGGHTYFIGRTPSPKILLQAFKEVKPTLIISVPLILEKIYRKQIAPQISKAPISWVLKVPYLEDVVLGKIREQLIEAFGGEFNQIILGGAPLNAEVEAFLRRIKFPLSVGYGMTECAPIISWSSYPDIRPYSCGKLWDGYMEARIDEPNEEGVGEIQVRGEHTMKGYYKNEEATKESFTEDGWLRTGDLGYIDEDGYLYIKGRNKTMLLGPNGQNIYPEEIEAKLNNMPYVLESLVIQQNDSRLVALVCPDYDAVDANGLDKDSLEKVMDDVRRDLNAQLANYEQISKIKLYPHEFEKTPKRSIKRFLYTSMAE